MFRIIQDFLRPKTRYTILFPARKNVNQVKKTLQSICDNTYYKDNIEVLVGIDEDDDELRGISHPNIMVRSYTFPRHENDYAFYYNKLASHATGDFLWLWSSENSLMTENWDKIANKKLDRSAVCLAESNDYIVNSEGSRTSFGHPISGELFSCFPMLSISAFQALGYVHNPNFRCWGNDLYLHMLFKYVKRIVELPIQVKSLDTSQDKEKLALYQEDIKKMEGKGLAKIDGQTVALNIQLDVKKIHRAIGIPEVVKPEQL